jgi:hypothetical protein
MAWKPIEQLPAAKRKDVMRRIVAGEVPSYVDPQGRRRVWASRDKTPFWALDLVAKVRAEVSRLQRRPDAAPPNPPRDPTTRPRPWRPGALG